MKVSNVKEINIKLLKRKQKQIERVYVALNVTYIPSLYCLGLSEYELFTFKELARNLEMANKLLRGLLTTLRNKDFDQAQELSKEYTKIRKHILEMILNTIPFESDVTNEIQIAIR